MKPSLTELSAAAATSSDAWVIIVGFVGIVAGIVWTYYDE